MRARPTDYHAIVAWGQLVGLTNGAINRARINAAIDGADTLSVYYCQQRRVWVNLRSVSNPESIAFFKHHHKKLAERAGFLTTEEKINEKALQLEARP